MRNLIKTKIKKQRLTIKLTRCSKKLVVVACFKSLPILQSLGAYHRKAGSYLYSVSTLKLQMPLFAHTLVESRQAKISVPKSIFVMVIQELPPGKLTLIQTEPFITGSKSWI